jgi:prepilin-type N-terminal cleavage/methylation domain-containing protein
MSRVAMRSESGFTLIELMVALIIGIVVSTATLAIVITSVHLSSNYNDRVDANQQGRTAMLKIVQALNSSCVASSVAPILSASDSNDVWFYSLLGDAPALNPNKVEISLTGGSLVMTTYPYASGSAPNWVFSGTASSTFTLVQHAQAIAIPSTAVFQYFGYGSGGALSTTAYSTSPNLGSNAATTAEVKINFVANPSDNWTALNRTASISDAVVLRLATASGASSATNLPCT